MPRRAFRSLPVALSPRAHAAALLSRPDKAGGRKFSKDFEEGSAQLQEFIKFFNSQCKTGPPLLQALSNADIFYEMQYKEVKIVANVSVAVSVQRSVTLFLSRFKNSGPAIDNNE